MVCGIVTLIGGLIGLAFLRPEAERARLTSRMNARASVAPA
jgi:hypothetical protein